MHADDMDLVREFATSGSEAAFAALVHRHVNLVYSAALRRLGNAAEAEEVAQVVFVILAQKAGSLRKETILSGWLYQTAQLTAANYHRAAVRRRRREQEAFMQFSEQSDSDVSNRRFGPLLEEAMVRLNPKERDAIVLRFFENRTVREVAVALGLREDAAQKRVNRATDKLRSYFVRRGVQVSVAALLASIGTQAAQAAPAGLAAKIAATVVLTGATGSTSTLTLIKTTLKLMAWTKAKTAVVAVTAAILATGTTTVIVKRIVSRPAPVAVPSIDDSFFEANEKKLLDAPANLVIVQPTHSTQISGPLSISGHQGMLPNTMRMSGRCVLLQDVVQMAYGYPETRMLFTVDVPKDKFDFLVTMPGDARKSLQTEIQKQWGLAGRQETRDMDVLLLKVKTPGAPGLKRGNGGGSFSSGLYSGGKNSGKYVLENGPLSTFAGFLEMHSVRRPVLDETGLSGNYNIELDGQVLNSENVLKEALLHELGLELVPGRKPIQMLVVERPK